MVYSAEGIELELVDEPIVHRDWWFSSNPLHAGDTMAHADLGCDEHRVLDDKHASTRVGISKKIMFFGMGLSMAFVMIGLGAKMMTSSKSNHSSADTSAVLTGTDPNQHAFNAAFVKKNTMTVGLDDDGDENEQEEVTNPEHEAASFPSQPFNGAVVEYECTTESGCTKKAYKDELPNTGNGNEPSWLGDGWTGIAEESWTGDGWMEKSGKGGKKNDKSTNSSKSSKSKSSKSKSSKSKSSKGERRLHFKHEVVSSSKSDVWRKIDYNPITHPFLKFPQRSLQEDSEGFEFNPDGWDNDGHYKADIEYVRSEVTRLIDESDRELIPKFLRLGFHDCVGKICDGCIDLNNPDNRGLEEAIDGIYPTVEKFKGQYSRADIWALATLVAADNAVIEDRPENLVFPMRFFGRVDCDGANERGVGGPIVPMPSSDLTTHELFEFFASEFNFNEREAVIILGAHAVAVARRPNVGFGNIGREDGWVENANSYILNNRYYHSVVEPMWHQEFLNNEQFNVKNRYQWYIDPIGVGPIMLNVDIALVRDLNGFIVTDENGVEGLTLCLFTEQAEFSIPTSTTGVHIDDVPLCPHSSSEDIVEEFGGDNHAFLFAFEKTLEKMVTTGYNNDIPEIHSGVW